MNKDADKWGGCWLLCLFLFRRGCGIFVPVFVVCLYCAFLYPRPGGGAFLCRSSIRTRAMGLGEILNNVFMVYFCVFFLVVFL